MKFLLPIRDYQLIKYCLKINWNLKAMSEEVSSKTFKKHSYHYIILHKDSINQNLKLY